MDRESWTIAWHLMKKFADMSDDEESWRDFYKERDQIIAENPDNQFLADLLVAIWNELRRQKAVR
ncbi:MAG: hypothetical protein IJ079_06800 [Lachnospiraceae bacterium]|nr:hypothetical protein [Lachnospiraceae bacterium]